MSASVARRVGMAWRRFARFIGRLVWRVAALGLVLGLAACGEDEGSFAQYPGFAEYFAAHPRSDDAPDAEARQLLMQYRPRLFIGPGQEGPIDFYADYIAHGTLSRGDGRQIGNVDAATLNAARDDAGAVFTHEAPPDPAPRPVAHGRLDRFETPLGPMTALTWTFTFRVSGLVAGLPWWKEWPARLLADAEDWHQLDHYTAYRLILWRERPVAVWMQQHNFMRTWLIGEGADWPDDDRFRVAAAQRSNEFYPYQPGRTEHRAISFPTEENLRFLILGGEVPMMGGHDITRPVREVDYALAFPPPADAFYSFQGRLGEKRLVWPRSGPPGADYNTLPQFKPLLSQLTAGYWRAGNPGDLRRLSAARMDARAGALDAQQAVLLHNIDCLATGRQGCALR